MIHSNPNLRFLISYFSSQYIYSCITLIRLKAEFLQASANPKSDPKRQTQGVSLIKPGRPICHSAHWFHLELLISHSLDTYRECQLTSEDTCIRTSFHPDSCQQQPTAGLKARPFSRRAPQPDKVRHKKRVFCSLRGG